MSAVVFVVGASGDLGLDVTACLAEQGAKVIAGYRSRLERLTDVAATFPLGQVEPVPIDVTNAATLDRAVDAAVARHGRLDALVFMSAVLRDNLLSFMTEEEWDTVVDTNLKGAFLACKAATRPMMKQRAGRIVLVSSLSGQRGLTGQANYAASKSGMIGLARSLAQELSRFNVLVNVVAPGLIESAANDKIDAKQRETLLSSLTLKRVGRRREVSSLLRWLVLDPDATYLTGQLLAVDGGAL